MENPIISEKVDSIAAQVAAMAETRQQRLAEARDAVEKQRAVVADLSQISDADILAMTPDEYRARQSDQEAAQAELERRKRYLSIVEHAYPQSRESWHQMRQTIQDEYKALQTEHTRIMDEMVQELQRIVEREKAAFEQGNAILQQMERETFGHWHIKPDENETFADRKRTGDPAPDELGRRFLETRYRAANMAMGQAPAAVLVGTH